MWCHCQLFKVSGVIFDGAIRWWDFNKPVFILFHQYCEMFQLMMVCIRNAVMLLQVTRLCDLSSETDSVTSVSWNERVCHGIFSHISLSHFSFCVVTSAIRCYDSSCLLVCVCVFINICWPKYLKWLETKTRFQWTTHRKWHMANRLVTWSTMSGDPLRVSDVAHAWQRLTSVAHYVLAS